MLQARPCGRIDADQDEVVGARSLAKIAKSEKSLRAPQKKNFSPRTPRSPKV
jgi:hypothetical protein